MTTWSERLDGDERARASTHDTRKYGRAALDGECQRVRSSSEGNRNDSLNLAALKTGKLIAGGLVTENEAIADLTKAALEVGLEEREISATIESGLERGKQEPRAIPARASNGSAVSANEPQEFALLGSEEIFAPLESPVFVVDQVVRRASVTEIVAYGSSGKSWIAVDLAISVASGNPWLGRFPAKEGGAVYLDYENGTYEMRRRMREVAQARKLEPQRLSLSSMPGIYMSDARKFATAVRAIAERNELIIIDTLRAACPGVDENDSRIREGLDILRRVGEESGCAFVVLIHSKKVTGNLTTIDLREAGRGSSAIFDAADSVLHIAYTAGEPLRVIQTKARLGRFVDPFVVRIDDLETGGVSVQASDAPKPEQASADRFSADCDAVLRVVRENPGASQTLIAEKVGKRPSTTKAALEHLARNGALKNTGIKSKQSWTPIHQGDGAP